MRAGQATIVLGPSGAGKTIFGLRFAAQGLESGERCLYVSFQETADQLVEKATSFGWDLTKAQAEGQLVVHYVPVGELDLDTIAAAVRRELAVTSVHDGNYAGRVAPVIWWIVGFVDILLAIRFVLKLLGGSTVSGFVTFMYNITQPLVAPFHGIFNTAVQGRSILEPESLVAIAIYSLIGWGIVSLIHMMTRTSRAEAV